MIDFRRIGYIGIGAVLFVLAQANPATSAAALPVLVMCGVLGTWRNALDFSLSPSRVEWAALVCSVAWAFCAWQGIDPMRSLQLSMPALAFLILLVGLGRERRADLAIPAMAWSLAAVATLWSAQVLVMYSGGDASPAHLVVRLDADWMVVPNDVAYAAVLWPLWLRGWNRRAGWQRVVIALALGVQLLGFAALGSRLAVLLALLALAIAVLRRRSRAQALTGAASLFLASIVLFLLVPGLADKGLQSLMSRIELWQAALQIFVESPLSGIGPHNYVLRYSELMSALELRSDPRLTPWPHSLPLELLAEVGIMGCSALAALLASGTPHAQRGQARPLSRLWPAIPALALCLFEASTLRVWLWMLAALWLGRANRNLLIDSCPISPDTPSPH